MSLQFFNVLFILAFVQHLMFQPLQRTYC